MKEEKNMHSLTKKRAKAMAIDTAISAAATAALEPLLRKKIKSEVFFNAVAPSLFFWGLEYVQLRLSGQTVGQKIAGIEIQSEEGEGLTTEQILKRSMHRDLASPFVYLKDRRRYDAYEGAKFPHDLYAGTAVKEK
jgi:uncharacterized RDD family membrane protein YckC